MPAEAEQLAAAYKAGGTIRQLAIEWGISREAVRTALRRGGVSVRTVVLTPNQLEEAARLRSQEGWSLNRLGKRYGVDPKTVKVRLETHVDAQTLDTE